MSIRTSINQINFEINDLVKEKEALQEKCEHPKKSVKKYSWRPGVIEDAYLCDDCDKYLGRYGEQIINKQK
jgi:hypothetical protein